MNAVRTGRRERLLCAIRVVLPVQPTGWEVTLVTILLTEPEAAALRETLDAKLIELRREESHTDSPRFRATLYELEAVLMKVLDQLGRVSA
jgi:hypothetical protein